jgi:glutamate---cysteine ligase / carboxylate-amine ligase
MPMRLEETICIAAICQAVIAKLYRLHEQNLSFRHYSRALIMENKWRAARYGLDGKMIDFGKQTEVPARDLMHEILEFVSDVVPALGSQEEVGYVRQILETGNGAARQLRVFQETNDLKRVVDYMIAETEHGLFESSAGGVGQ